MKQYSTLYGSLLLVLLVSTVQASVQVACESIGNKLSSITVEECLALDMQAADISTVEGRTIVYKEYPPLQTKKPRARVLLLGGLHGDEYASFSVVFKWMHILMQHHSGLFHWIIAPAMNVDGLLKPPAVRANANGVDLNRNFPTGHWEDAIRFWKQEMRSNPRRYPGTYGMSENEVQWLVQQIKHFAPDVIISVHTPYNLVDYDGPENISPPSSLGSLKYKDLATFHGSLGRYGESLGIPVVTIELASSRYMPTPQEIKAMWLDLVQWLIHAIKESE